MRGSTKRFVLGIALMLAAAIGFLGSGLGSYDTMYFMSHWQDAESVYMVLCGLFFLAGLCIAVWESFIVDKRERNRAEVTLDILVNGKEIDTLTVQYGTKKHDVYIKAKAMESVRTALQGRHVLDCTYFRGVSFGLNTNW